jgi:Thioredoxin like C-terminal domain
VLVSTMSRAHVNASGTPHLNEWSLTGDWTVGGERADLNAMDGAIVYRFHARNVHLVLGSAPGVSRSGSV